MSSNTAVPSGPKKWLKMPHTFVILIFLTLVAGILTYVVPAGEFERVKNETTGKTLLVPGSYAHVDPNPVTLWDIPKSIVSGLVDSADVVFFILIIGGVFQIITSSGRLRR